MDFVLSDSIPPSLPVVTGSEDSAAQANDVVSDGSTVKSAVAPVDNDDNSSTESNTSQLTVVPCCL